MSMSTGNFIFAANTNFYLNILDSNYNVSPLTSLSEINALSDDKVQTTGTTPFLFYAASS